MINNVTLLGRICSDVELRTTNTGKSVANFRIAVDRAYSKGNDKQADFITIVAWENTADFVSKYFGKGSMIALRGEIQTRNYEDNKGNKRTAFEVLAREVSFCGSKNDNQSVAPTSMSAPAPAYSSTDTSTIPGFSQMPTDDFEEIGTDDDLPF